MLVYLKIVIASCPLPILARVSRVRNLTRNRSQTRKTISSVTEIKGIFRNPADGRLRRARRRAVRPQNILEITIYPVRGTLSYPRFPRPEEARGAVLVSGPSRNYSSASVRARCVSCAPIPATNTSASAPSHTRPPTYPCNRVSTLPILAHLSRRYIGLAHIGRPSLGGE